MALPQPRNGPVRPMIPPTAPPPNGSAGAAQQTPAAQVTMMMYGGPSSGWHSFANRGSRSRSRRAAPRRKTKTRKVSATRKTKRGNRLVKGSAAAKAWGRKMKRLRKR